MKQKYVIQEFNVICNGNGKVEQVSNYSGEDFMEIGINFSRLIEEQSRHVFMKFLCVVKNKGYALGYVLNMIIDHKMQPVSLNGIYKKHKIHISVLTGCQGSLKVLKEIQTIKQTQINQDKALNEYVNMLEEWVMKDALTNLPNHRGFNTVIYKEAKKAYELNYQCTIILIAIDNLKEFNDTFGYKKGDDFLLSFVSLARKSLRSQKDFIFRLGGDEFLILCTDINYMDAFRVMEKIDSGLKDFSIYAAISYGIVEIFPEQMGDNFDINFYLEDADRKIKQVKSKKIEYQFLYKI